jgi:exodeoxyribonuclease V gamma subunit
MSQSAGIVPIAPTRPPPDHGVPLLHVHHSPDADDLVAALAGVLAVPLGDVFVTEQVAVHSRGLERWVAQRLSHHLGTDPGDGDGACIGVDFPFPGRLVQRALARAATAAHDPDHDPWDHDPWRVERLAWQLLRLTDAHPDLLDGTPLAAHVTEPDGSSAGGRDATILVAPTSVRRFGALRRVADLFDRYAVHRPAMLRGWAAGDTTPSFDDGRPLPATHAWQARLWRSLRDEVVATTGVPSPPERLADAAARLASDPDVADLPDRVALFGLTALPASYLDVLRALALHRDVHLFLLHPSPGLWRRALPHLGPTATGAPPRRDADPLADLPANPLLRSWARDAREMQVVLAAAGLDLPADPVPPAPVPASASRGRDDGDGAGARDTDRGARDTDRDARVTDRVTRDSEAPGPPTLLRRLQADVHGDVAPPGPAAPGTLDLRAVLDPDDRSIQVHGCHGPTRQVEVLRDVLLHRFAADPTLEPRDVLVLCPDLATYAPLLEATFAAGAPDAGDATGAPAGRPAGPPDRLNPSRLRLPSADRTVARANPLLRVTTQVLDLVDGRVSASQVRDLLARPAVRRAFGFDDAGLARLDGWIDAIGARWGIDGDDRARLGVPSDAGTWRWALDRLLVGVGVADEDLRTVGAVVPFDDVSTSDVDLVGRFAEALARLDLHLRRLRTPRTIDVWRDDLRAALDALTATDDTDAWQRLQLDRILDDAVRAATGVDDTVAPVRLSLEELRGLLRDRFDVAGAGANHRTGDLTVATLVPMRSVPHRVTVLLGLDDGAVPRRGRSDGDDLLDLDPHVGDRDPRTEDRQLLLDALLATREQLLVLYTARDERTNEPRPPALPVGELLDVIDRTVRLEPVGDLGPSAADPPRPSTQLTVLHPLRATDPSNFLPGALGVPGLPFSSDTVDLAGARACVAGDRTARARFLTSPLPRVEDDGLVELGQLIRAVTDPVGTLLAERFGLRFDRGPEGSDDELALELANLGRWAVGDRLLRATLHGADVARALHLERARGSVPPGELATPGLTAVTDDLAAFAALLADHELTGEPSAPVQIDLPLDDGRRLVGAVDEVVGTTRRAVGYSRLKERARLGAWVRLLALSAAHPGTPWRAVSVGRQHHRASKGTVVSASILGPLGTDAASRREHALRELSWLVEVRDRALTEPLPLATATSCRFATTLRELREPGSRLRSTTSAASQVWEDGMFPGEASSGAHALVHGGAVPFVDLLAEEPREDEEDPPWDTEEPSRFGRWALRLWGPLFDAETLDDRAAPTEDAS